MEKILKSKFYNGHWYSAVKRTDRKAWYFVEDLAGLYHYEVFRVKIKQPDKFKPVAREVFPANEDFGKTAWAFWSYKEAKKKYCSIK